MTERSNRRAAEMAVIDAAVKWKQVRSAGSAGSNVDPGDFVGSTVALVHALQEYEELGLAQVGQAATSNHDGPETSNEAAASLHPDNLAKLARRVFDEIAYVYANGGAGLTCDQVEQNLGGSHQTISARVNELRDKGYIVDTGIRRKTRSGRKAAVYRPTVLAAVPSWRQ